MSKVMRDVPFQAAQFISACRAVKELPDQNGDEDWAVFNSMLKQLKEYNIDIRMFISGYVSEDLAQSPLFEILFGSLATVKPPTTFSSAKGPEKVEIYFTAKEFISLCIKINDEYIISETYGTSPHIDDFILMIRTLSHQRVNILEFLSSEITDDLLIDCPYFRLIMHTTSASRSHVIIQDSELYNAPIEFSQPQGFVHHGSHMHVPPYPPSQYGLTFDQTQFLQCMQVAEADIGKYSFSESEDSDGLDILHK